MATSKSADSIEGQPPRRFVWGLFAILVLAAIPRVMEALRTPLVFDEIYALMLARRGLHGLLATLAQDVDQPLHFILVWAQTHLSGEDPLGIKVLPLVFGLATVWATAQLGRAMFGWGAGLVAALLVAFQPTHVYFSQQGTFHAMEWFLATMVAWLGWRWLERPNKRDAVFVVLAGAAAAYSDYFAMFWLVLIAVGGVVKLWRTPGRIGAWLAIFVVIAVLYAPQLPTIVSQIRRDIAGEAHLAPMPWRDLFDLVRKIANNASYWVPVTLVLALAPLVVRARRGPALFLWWVILGAMIVPWRLSNAGIHLFITRQMMFTIPLWCTLIAAGATSVPWPLPRWALAAAVVVFAARATRMHEPLGEPQNLKRTADWLRTHAAPTDLIACTETRALAFLRFYLPEHTNSRLLLTPQTEKFHYSDGILVIPDEWNLSVDEFDASRARNPHWFGVRLQHAGRDGIEAARVLESHAAGGVQNLGRVQLWSGVPADSLPASP